MRRYELLKIKKESVNRRNFLHKIVGLAAFGGLASLILGNKIEKAHALDGSGDTDQITFWSDTNTITGSNNLRWDNTNRNFIGSYSGNKTETSTVGAITGATISGGGESGNVNKVTDDYGTVGGGKKNQAGDNDGDASDADYATVGGGFSNTASGQYSTVGGGDNNTASADRSTVSGGWNNTSSGNCSTVPGGRDNTAAGYYSLAAGRRAKIDAAHDGTFLFADSNDANFNSARTNEFAVRCTNGARFVAGSINPGMKVENTSSGQGIYGKSNSGIGIKAESTSGTALHVEGNNFFKSAKKGTIPTGVREYEVDVSPYGITIASDAMIFVTIMNNPSNIGVKWVERISDTRFKIHLTGLSRNIMNIGWFVVN